MRRLLDGIYLCLLLALAPWLAWNAWRKGKYREGFSAKFLGRVPPRASDRPGIWLHAVSVGEVNLLAPVVDALLARHPEHDIVISTTTRTGYALAQRKYAELQVFYCPLDFSWAVREVLRRVRPQLLVLAELELWPNLVSIAAEEGVRIAVINGRMGTKSWRGYRRIRRCITPLLQRIDVIAVQTEEYASRFVSLGAVASRVHVTGNVKFDRLSTDRRQTSIEQLRRAAGIRPDDVIFLAGSTQDPEEELAIAALSALAPAHPKLRLIVCPRHPERFDSVAKLIRGTGIPFQQRSALGSASGAATWRILLIDSVGELSDWWGTADIAFVGGSLTERGGQNMLEPAAFGAAVSFGPNTWNFRDIVSLLLDQEAAAVVRDRDELIEFVQRSLECPDRARAMGHRAQQLVISQQGATNRTLELLAQLLKQSSPPLEAGRTAA